MGLLLRKLLQPKTSDVNVKEAAQKLAEIEVAPSRCKLWEMCISS